jgi:hypothetical protein
MEVRGLLCSHQDPASGTAIAPSPASNDDQVPLVSFNSYLELVRYDYLSPAVIKGRYAQHELSILTFVVYWHSLEVSGP